MLLSTILLQERVRMVKRLFRDKSQTEFIIATIPTMLGINESSRLLDALRSEDIPCKRIIVNQVSAVASFWLIQCNHDHSSHTSCALCESK